MKRPRMALQAMAIDAARWLVASAFLFAIGAEARAFEISSEDVQPAQPISQKFIFNGLGCQGQNVSPVLAWTSPPDGTMSFAPMGRAVPHRKAVTSHRYNLGLYALKMEKLNLASDAAALHPSFVLNLHTLDKATLTMTQGR